MKALRRYMERRRLSQEAFASRIGVTQSMVSQWLTGKRPVSAKSARAIERVTEGEITRAKIRADLFA